MHDKYLVMKYHRQSKLFISRKCKFRVSSWSLNKGSRVWSLIIWLGPFNTRSSVSRRGDWNAESKVHWKHQESSAWNPEYPRHRAKMSTAYFYCNYMSTLPDTAPISPTLPYKISRIKWTFWAFLCFSLKFSVFFASKFEHSFIVRFLGHFCRYLVTVKTQHVRTAS